MSETFGHSRSCAKAQLYIARENNMNKGNAELVKRMIEILDEGVQSYKGEVTVLESKAEKLWKDLSMCRAVMTDKQKCMVFQEQNCATCDDLSCGDNLNEKMKGNNKNNSEDAVLSLLHMSTAEVAGIFLKNEKSKTAAKWAADIVGDILILKEDQSIKDRKHLRVLGEKLDKILSIVNAAGTTKGIPVEDRVEHLWKRSISCGASGQQITEIEKTLDAAGVAKEDGGVMLTVSDRVHFLWKQWKHLDQRRSVRCKQ